MYLDLCSGSYWVDCKLTERVSAVGQSPVPHSSLVADYQIRI